MKGHSRKERYCEAKRAWKSADSEIRWERRANRLMEVFSAVTVMLPSQITYLKQKASQTAMKCDGEG